ncbi:hypothetical protein AQUCO_05800140v1 [Aquilegia coerulea]|uniref:Leucine-rich repeat-containing N-terminal plant-type domain-containing protein n=1 Tax=Aquilegia coerulea TaxID=218851 RepID=A0A2G5CEX9_AQUCA|nr:hypothetical protein AQUCO_05800140v1 [Aquilegia coerulea]
MAFTSSTSSLLALAFLCFSISAYTCFAKCHVDDETALLAFKSGITQDPTGMLSSWIPATDCCTWSGIECLDSNKRVSSLSLFGESDPNFFVTGTISPSLSKLRYLQGLYLQHLRNLTGTFPTFIFNLPDLNQLYLDNNKLSGPLPLDIGQKLHPQQFVGLSLSENRFTGSIPSSISQLVHLRDLDLGSNLFSGPIPSGIQQMKNLVFLNLEKNQLSGKIPNFFTSFTSLRELDLSHNKLSGEIPPTISFLAPRLELLNLGHNLLAGNIPNYLGNFQTLDRLDLSSNQLTGVVPTTFKNLTDILYLELGHNHLVDPFPEMNVKKIEGLDLSYNKFNLGTIPKWVESSALIYSLKLAGCGLKFRLEDFKPREKYFYDYIDLSDNQISGTPVGLMNETTLLKGFWASGNQLRFNLSDLRLPNGLKTLVLARNQIFGKVPQNISRLEKVDLSHNHLCGPIPATKFAVKAFLGNDCLCGSPLPPCKN